jgi:hypothetical protein
MGRDYCNTELRQLSDPQFFNFISLDDGKYIIKNNGIFTG